MKAYKFKTEEDKAIFYSFLINRSEEIDMFDYNRCSAVRITLNEGLHLLKSVDYRDIELVEDINVFMLMCN